MDSHETTSSFSHFGELPMEIRLKVWNLAAQEPRLIYVKCQKVSYQSGTRKLFYAKEFTSATPPPAVLQVCHESRAETLSQYQLCFSTAHSPARIYVNLNSDTVRAASLVLAYLGPVELCSIRSLSLEVMDLPYFAHFNMGFLRKMENLEFLELLAIQGQAKSWSLRVLRTLMEDFDEERDRFAEGKMPNIRIISSDTGEELAAMTNDGGWTGGFAMHLESQAGGRSETDRPGGNTQAPA